MRKIRKKHRNRASSMNFTQNESLSTATGNTVNVRPSSETGAMTNRTELSELPKFVGLMNLGNTCYMNSLLQTLFMIPEFRNAVLGIDVDTCQTPNNETLKALQRLFFEMMIATNRLYLSGALKSFFRTLNPESAALGVQRDLLEERRALFALIRRPSGWPHLDNLFRGRQERRLQCLCTRIVTCSSSFEDIPAPLRRSDRSEFMDNLVDCLKCTTATTVLTGDNAFTCLDCGKPTPHLSQTIYTEMPKLLCIQLMRFVINRHARNYSKIGKPVRFDTDELDFSTIIQTVDGYRPPCPKYKLLSVVVHTGSVEFGHYFAYIRDLSDNQWYCFNDSRVTFATVDDVQNTFGGFDHDPCAYCLLYRRTDDNLESFKPLSSFPHLQNNKTKTQIIYAKDDAQCGSSSMNSGQHESIHAAAEKTVNVVPSSEPGAMTNRTDLNDADYCLKARII